MAANLHSTGPAALGEDMCPHLALREDRRTCMGYPSPWNLCHRCRPAAAVRLSHQRQACLTQFHTECTVFQSLGTLPLPDPLRPLEDGCKDPEHIGTSEMPSVLFVCMANRFRSPLAAAFFRQRLAQAGMIAAWQVSSAGMWADPDLPVPEAVQKIAEQYGLELSGHRSRRVDHGLLASYELVLVMQASQREALLTEFPEFQEAIHELSQVAECRTYDIPDVSASGQDMAEIAVELNDLVQCGFESMCNMAASLYNLKHGQAA